MKKPEKLSIHNLNKCAKNNVKDLLIVKMDEYKIAEQEARKNGKVEKCIEMYHDMFCLYEHFFMELNNIS